MHNRFDPVAAADLAARFPGLRPELATRLYTSRLLGLEADLVLHGGGNTSVKLCEKDLTGRDKDVLYVKASGTDLAVMGPEGLVALDLTYLTRLKNLDRLSDEDMANQLLVSRLQADDPPPSIDAWVHAFLPHLYVDHTHADAILILTNQVNGVKLVTTVLGPKVVVCPYVRPGFALGRAVAEVAAAHPDAEAVVVMGHGIFTYADQADLSYRRMIDLVTRAEEWLASRHRPLPPAPAPTTEHLARMAQVIRGACAHEAPDGVPRRFIAEIRTDRDIVAVSLDPAAAEWCRSGVLTPDHVIRTKNQYVYLKSAPEDDSALQEYVRKAIGEYLRDYECYFSAGQAVICYGPPRPEDPYPRVFLVAGLGLITLGPTSSAAGVAADIAVHTLRAKIKARDIGLYQPLPDEHIFDMEFWPLQRRKLGQGPSLSLEGQIAIVTGAGGAIGLGIADRLLAAGAVVTLTDVDQGRLEKVHDILADRFGAGRIHALTMDVTDYSAVASTIIQISTRWGGLDLLVPNAGIAHVANIEDLDPDRLDQVMAVNFKGVFHLLKAAAPVFRRQGTGGNIVIVSTKNVLDPGASFGAYSASKAAAHQLGKIAALEMAKYGVRVNMLNPDAIFGDERVSSKLWDLVGPDRMRSRGLDPAGLREYYRLRNLLQVTVTAEHVGNAVVFFASSLTPTTGATLPIDGGVPGAFPR